MPSWQSLLHSWSRMCHPSELLPPQLSIGIRGFPRLLTFPFPSPLHCHDAAVLPQSQSEDSRGEWGCHGAAHQGSLTKPIPF